mmetsp:Transcript_47162/g.100979  ORF Transcript_47162/g.100979 Transcript_47162/m.100979 type:complete len:304 (-) Transcript_47162:786-1697(-)
MSLLQSLTHLGRLGVVAEAEPSHADVHIGGLKVGIQVQGLLAEIDASHGIAQLQVGEAEQEARRGIVRHRLQRLSELLRSGFPAGVHGFPNALVALDVGIHQEAGMALVGGDDLAGKTQDSLALLLVACPHGAGEASNNEGTYLGEGSVALQQAPVVDLLRVEDRSHTISKSRVDLVELPSRHGGGAPFRNRDDSAPEVLMGYVLYWQLPIAPEPIHSELFGFRQELPQRVALPRNQPALCRLPPEREGYTHSPVELLTIHVCGHGAGEGLCNKIWAAVGPPMPHLFLEATIFELEPIKWALA